MSDRPGETWTEAEVAAAKARRAELLSYRSPHHRKLPTTAARVNRRKAIAEATAQAKLTRGRRKR